MAELDNQKIINNKNEAVNKVNQYLDSCIAQDKIHAKKANLISYWLKDFFKYIEQEETFDSSYLKEYSRGDIIKVNLGFNVGNEEGGLHYCIVLDKKNAKSHSTLTVIPLTSLKSNSKKRRTSVFLGNEIALKVLEKAKSLLLSIDRENAINYQLKFEKYYHEGILDEITPEEEAAAKDLKDKHILIEKIIEEASQMKVGSIALINQITTISKQRIYNPKHDIDILSGIKLSDEKMALIDERIKKLYIN